KSSANATPTVASPITPETALTEFSAWAQQYLSASPADRFALPLDRGYQLAKARRQAMSNLIRANPRQALALAVPAGWRRELPLSIASLLEERVSGRGKMDTYCAISLPGPDYKDNENGEIRYVTLGGKTYRAFVYGRRVTQMSLKDAALHGVAVDNFMAVSEEPLRPLDTDEANAFLAAGNQPTNTTCPVCGAPLSGMKPPVLADFGGQIIAFDHPAHLGEMNRTLAAAEDAKITSKATPLAQTGPGNTPQPTSPVSTFGPRHVLYIRAVFADDRTVPITEAEAALEMKQVNDFYVEASYNKTALITTVTPVLTLRQAKLFYGSQGPGALADDARAAAQDAGYNPAAYELVVIRHTNVPGFRWGGLGGGGTAWLQASGTGIAAHEIGHNYGLPHANFWNTRRAEPPTPGPWDTDSLIGHDSVIGPGSDVSYGDPHDVMGSGAGESAAAAGDTNVIASFNGHFNVVGKALLGWLPGAYIADGDHGTTTRLYAQDTSALVEGRSYAISVRKDAERTYFVSSRSRFPNDPYLQNGVELHWGPWQQSIGYSHILDTTPGTSLAQN
ncbi:MAG TPA: M66 family metalloprotease, partial [Verrucomicrobiae bacterium]|nr:M66 family metalloprotease [Verrucomicrobiae bacterium]